MLEKGLVRYPARNRDDLPAGRRLQMPVESGEIGNPRRDRPQHIEAAQKLRPGVPAQPRPLLIEHRPPGRLLRGGPPPPALAPRPPPRAPSARPPPTIPPPP